MSNFINAEVEELREHLKKYYDETIYLEGENKKLKEEVKDLIERNIELDKKYMLVLTENKRLREELNKKNMETWFDEKAENIYKSQKENILMGKI